MRHPNGRTKRETRADDLRCRGAPLYAKSRAHRPKGRRPVGGGDIHRKPIPHPIATRCDQTKEKKRASATSAFWRMSCTGGKKKRERLRCRADSSRVALSLRVWCESPVGSTPLLWKADLFFFACRAAKGRLQHRVFTLVTRKKPGVERQKCRGKTKYSRPSLIARSNSETCPD